MKRFLVLALVACLMMVGFVACDSDLLSSSSKTESESLAKVIFDPVLEQAKSMSVSSIDMAAVSYKFLAEPASKNNDMKGSTDGTWTSLTSAGDNKYQTGNRFSVGQWVFTVRAYNKNGGLIYEGTSGTVLLQTGDNNVTIGLSEKVNTDATAKGTVAFTVSTPRLIANGQPGTMTFSFADTNGNAVTPTVSKEVSGAVNSAGTGYDFTAEYKLPAGLYVVTVNYSETEGSSQVSMAGSVVAFRVIENSTTTVTGDMQESLYANAIISMGAKKVVSGEISYVISNGTYTCKFKSATESSNSNKDNYLQPTAYQWYVDGERKTEGITGTGKVDVSTFYYEPGKSYGNHSITCVAIYSDGTFSSICSRSVSIEVTSSN